MKAWRWKIGGITSWRFMSGVSWTCRIIRSCEHTVSKCLETLGIIQKQGHWILYELKLRDVEQHLVTCKQLPQWQKKKVFLHHIMTSNEKWIHYDKPKCRRSWGKPSMHQHWQQNQISMIQSFCSEFGGISWL